MVVQGAMHSERGMAVAAATVAAEAPAVTGETRTGAEQEATVATVAAGVARSGAVTGAMEAKATQAETQETAEMA